ncbi:hypothetical protein [Candidatus Planktophila versatilis]|uniref:hypothetical protein n=1 Tax=Candidatus Planktophila versatilis TaxID=1884905 RepID=UPI003BEF3216
MKILISLICVATIAIILSRRLRLSTRYERAPRNLTQWNALDKGIDPTEEKQ